MACWPAHYSWNIIPKNNVRKTMCPPLGWVLGALVDWVGEVGGQDGARPTVFGWGRGGASGCTSGSEFATRSSGARRQICLIQKYNGCDLGLVFTPSKVFFSRKVPQTF